MLSSAHFPALAGDVYKRQDLEAVAPDYFDALLQAAADSADISTTRTYADLDVSRFYDELIAARAELDASGGEVA